MTWFIGLITSFFSNLAKGYAVYLKGKADAKKDFKIEQLEADVAAAKRLQNVKETTTRESALERLRRLGKVRD
jgi:hypothetical protein